MKLQILQPAEAEIAEAMDYYNNQYSGLGYEFAFEVRESMNRIISYPNAWPLFLGKTRKCHVNRFPYGIIYEVKAKVIIVFAIIHLKKNPKTWEQRVCEYKK
jgi:hypothetical protein